LRILASILVFLLHSGLAHAEAKIALVIGNDDYGELTDLQRAREDAEGYAEWLRAEGFDVDHVQDASDRELRLALARLYEKIEPGSTVVFAYSGHGWSDGSTNFLVPTDAPSQGSEEQIRAFTLPLSNGVSGIIDEINRRGASRVFAIIDACRDNPFAIPPQFRTTALRRGMTRETPPPGTFIAMSAGVGQAALDRLGDDDDARYSVFTRFFLPELRAGLDLGTAMDRAEVAVARAAQSVGHIQVPSAYEEWIGTPCLLDNCVEPGLTTASISTSSDGATTYTVIADGSGDFRTVAEAVENAQAGDTIAVYPGRYLGGVVVDEPISIVGVGDRRQILWESADEDLVHWTAWGGRIANMTMRLTGGQGFFSGDDEIRGGVVSTEELDFVIEFNGGSALVEGNDLTSRVTAPIIAAYGQADPIIRENLIRDGSANAIGMFSAATGEIVENEIFGHASHGILISTNANPVVRATSSATAETPVSPLTTTASVESRAITSTGTRGRGSR
jgi:hypothetical protein